MKKYLPLIFTLLPLICHSQDVIYKCISSKGEVNYVNISSAANKANGCIKTDIAGVDRSPIREVDNKKTTGTPSNGNGMTVYNEDQKNRDTKRQTILQKELQEEEVQLATITTSIITLSNNKGVDPKQVQDLTNLQVIHKKNIEALRKELGIKDNSPTLAVAPLKIEKISDEVVKTDTEKFKPLTK